MEKLVTDELTKTVILLGMAMAGASALLVKLIMLITKIHGSFKPYQKATLNYLLVALLLFAAIACLAYWSYLQNQQAFFWIYQAYFLVLGVIHVYWMRGYLKWSGNTKSLWSELLFTLVTALLGSIVFIIVHRFFNNYDQLAEQGFFNFNLLEQVMATSTIFFVVPWFVNQTFKSAIDIPDKVLKQWYYPVNQEMEEPDEEKLKNLLVISFVFRKQTTDIHYTHFRAKAPVDMEMGELFYYFINDYNERHPNEKIEFIDDAGEPHGWVFYKKPRLYTLLKQYIHADKTIYTNRIRENDVIICSRSMN